LEGLPRGIGIREFAQMGFGDLAAALQHDELDFHRGRAGSGVLHRLQLDGWNRLEFVFRESGKLRPGITERAVLPQPLAQLEGGIWHPAHG